MTEPKMNLNVSSFEEKIQNFVQKSMDPKTSILDHTQEIDEMPINCYNRTS